MPRHLEPQPSSAPLSLKFSPERYFSLAWHSRAPASEKGEVGIRLREWHHIWLQGSCYIWVLKFCLQVPSWVSPALHTGNFAGLLLDLWACQEQRTFRTSSSILSAAINIAYMAYLYYTRIANGSYPYAFLESMPEPFGVILTAIILVVGVEALFLGARKSKEKLLWWRLTACTYFRHGLLWLGHPFQTWGSASPIN